MHTTTPRLGTNWDLRGEGAPRVVAGVVVLGRIADPPQVLRGTCINYVDPLHFAIVGMLVPTTPTWRERLPLPNIPVLHGITLAAQVWFAPSANPNGFELSNAIYLTLGS